MSLLGTFIYRPFAKFRERWADLCNADEKSSSLRKIGTDISGNILFFTPIYSATMHFLGASLEEIGLHWELELVWQ